MPPLFPAETVPDNAIFAPHHLYIGLLVVAFTAALTWNDRGGREPAIALGAILACWFAFEYIWPYYHATGAAISLLATLAILAAVLAAPFWGHYDWLGLRGLALVGVLIAADDLVSHAFGIWTPIDGLLWKGWLYPALT